MGIVSGYLILSIEILKILPYFCRILVHMFDELIGIVDRGGSGQRVGVTSYSREMSTAHLGCHARGKA